LGVRAWAGKRLLDCPQRLRIFSQGLDEHVRDPLQPRRAPQFSAGSARRGAAGMPRGGRGRWIALLSPPAESEEHRSFRGWGWPFFWILLFCGYPAANPAGALRATKSAPGRFVFGQTKTNSPGANLDSRRLARRAKPRDGFCSSISAVGPRTHIQDSHRAAIQDQRWADEACPPYVDLVPEGHA
jgi:hypothetical protein